MERAYRIEAGLEEAPAAERAGSGARPRPQARAGGAMLTTGEAAAAENEALMTDIVSAVERERLERMRKNQAMMAQLGLLDAAGDLSEVLEEEKAAKRPAPRKRREKVVIPMEQRRRTGRDRKQAERFGDLVPDEFVLGPASHGFVGGERGSSACAAHGEVDGVEVGRLWLARVGVSRDGVHGPWVGGIHGNANSGAFSVVLSGGYEGDVDRGTEFSYTGSGGAAQPRDPHEPLTHSPPPALAPPRGPRTPPRAPPERPDAAPPRRREGPVREQAHGPAVERPAARGLQPRAGRVHVAQAPPPRRPRLQVPGKGVRAR